jgi:hypothetical protein
MLEEMILLPEQLIRKKLFFLELRPDSFVCDNYFETD